MVVSMTLLALSASFIIGIACLAAINLPAAGVVIVLAVALWKSC